MTRLLNTLQRYSNGTNTHEDKQFLKEVMNANGDHIQQYDSITEVILDERDGKHSATIEWYWSARQCGNTEFCELEDSVIMADDPIKTANIQRLQSKMRDTVWRLRAAESSVTSYEKELMRLENELAKWELK